MKKIIFTLFITSSTVVFAKSEEPKSKIDLTQQEFLIINKTIKEQKIQEKKVVLLVKEAIHPCVIVAVVPPPFNMGALGACLSDLMSQL